MVFKEFPGCPYSTGAHWEHSDCQGKRGGCREKEEQGKSRNDSDPVVSNLGLRLQGIFPPGKLERDGEMNLGA